MSRVCTEALRWQGVWRVNMVIILKKQYLIIEVYCIGITVRRKRKLVPVCEFDENAVRKKDGSAVLNSAGVL